MFSNLYSLLCMLRQTCRSACQGLHRPCQTSPVCIFVVVVGGSPVIQTQADEIKQNTFQGICRRSRRSPDNFVPVVHDTHGRVLWKDNQILKGTQINEKISMETRTRHRMVTVDGRTSQASPLWRLQVFLIEK